MTLTLTLINKSLHLGDAMHTRSPIKIHWHHQLEPRRSYPSECRHMCSLPYYVIRRVISSFFSKRRAFICLLSARRNLDSTVIESRWRHAHKIYSPRIIYSEFRQYWSPRDNWQRSFSRARGTRSIRVRLAAQSRAYPRGCERVGETLLFPRAKNKRAHLNNLVRVGRKREREEKHSPSRQKPESEVRPFDELKARSRPEVVGLYSSR